uniref:Uncharacterized protein n=1 Tax=Tanacetum cinerariifolium TaxID=118510 RepID=A0A6L2JK98_TANCI|nr:hypothetical protein [Tanacetum cinerariifolium]
MVHVVILHRMYKNAPEITVKLDGKFGQRTGQPNPIWGCLVYDNITRLTPHIHLKTNSTVVKRDDEIKVLEEINIELESGTHKLIEKLSQEKVSQEEALENFNSMVERDDEIKSSDHFGWDWPEKDSLVEALSDQEVANDCLDDEHVKERRPSKRIRVTQEEMVKDEKLKKG